HLNQNPGPKAKSEKIKPSFGVFQQTASVEIYYKVWISGRIQVGMHGRLRRNQQRKGGQN
ncbi:hypothetical protein, partial [Acidocella sp. MX-AZ02]|uniref:hypothetical protein n=1 Tax=Acidocella sp. MX-AZ02 TaxID=1214225 RepID=UPI001969B861